MNRTCMYQDSLCEHFVVLRCEFRSTEDKSSHQVHRGFSHQRGVVQEPVLDSPLHVRLVCVCVCVCVCLHVCVFVCAHHVGMLWDDTHVQLPQEYSSLS